MMLHQLIARIEDLIPCSEGRPNATAETGELYVCLHIGGAREAGDPMDFCSSKATTVRLLCDAIVGYVMMSTQQGKRDGYRLLWRTKPQIESAEVKIGDGEWSGKRTVWKGYCRLLVTDKPAATAGAT